MQPQEFVDLVPFKLRDYQIDYIDGICNSKPLDKNYLVTAPTGTGKSLAFELCANLGKTIYVVPIRELANEKFKEIPEKYPHLNVLRDTGADVSLRKDFDYVNQDVIITTTERLLSIFNNKIKEKVFSGVEYIVFDEIHMIQDVSRGSTLEWVIMLIKRFHPKIMIVGLSATLPNYKPFADWLNANYTWLPDNKRPIPLKFFFGDPIPRHKYTMAKKRDHKFSQFVTYTYKFKEQFLVFLSSKREIEKYAKKFAGLPSSASLQDIMQKGIAFHHADIDEDMKAEVVKQFKEGKLRVIFSSPTLAIGVNLPATNCVIFDISFYDFIAMKHIPLSADKLTQMFGRAGRFGYSDVGRVIILGDENEIAIAKEHINNPPDIISQFGRILVDKILNMISSKIANNIPEIYLIIKESFFFYLNDEFNMDLIQESIELLLTYKLIRTDDDYNYTSTLRGMTCTRLYIKVHTLIDAIKKISSIDPNDLFSVYRVLLGNEDFLSGVPFDPSTKDSVLASRTKRFFKPVYTKTLVNIYDHETNSHILSDKNDSLLKALAMIFKNDVLGKSYDLRSSHSALWKIRSNASAIASRLYSVLKYDIDKHIPDERFMKYIEMSLKYGTLDKKTIELVQIEGLGQRSIDKLIAVGIDTKEKFLKTSVKKLKAYGIRNAKSILSKQGVSDDVNKTTLEKWF